MNPRNFISGAEIADNVSSLNEELLEDSKALHIKRLQALSDKAYLEKVQIEEAETLAAGYNRLISAGIIKAKRRKTLNEMAKSKKIKYSDRQREIVNKVKIAAPVIKAPVNIEDIFEEPMDPIKRLPPKTISQPAQPAVQRTTQSAPPAPVVVKRPVQPVPPAPVVAKADSDLVSQLEGINIEEEETEEEVIEEEEVAPAQTPAVNSLERFGISQDMLDQWKDERGQSSVYCLFISPEEVFVFTHLRKAEHKAIMDKFAEFSKAKDPKVAAAAEEKLKELVVRNCVLFPEPSTLNFDNERAGLIESLFSSIWARSLFLTPAQLEALTVTL